MLVTRRGLWVNDSFIPYTDITKIIPICLTYVQVNIIVFYFG